MFQNLGRALLHLRSRTGKSQTAIARAAGIGKSQLSKYEQGKELPKLESLERVLHALGLGYFEFFWALDVFDRGETGKPVLTREEIDERLACLTVGLFALHREIIGRIGGFTEAEPRSLKRG
jgi:transcriptional regulator with XRE-family HTH domain